MKKYLILSLAMLVVVTGSLQAKDRHRSSGIWVNLGDDKTPQYQMLMFASALASVGVRYRDKIPVIGDALSKKNWQRIATCSDVVLFAALFAWATEYNFQP